jgi:hypothetical protein
LDAKQVFCHARTSIAQVFCHARRNIILSEIFAFENRF